MTTPSPASSGSAPAALVQALQQLYRAHCDAVFGYPLVGVHVGDPSQATRARLLESAHADRRDAVAARLVTLGATPTTPDATPTPPRPITGARDAQAWAVGLEDAVGAAIRYLLVADLAAAPAVRKDRVAALTQAARDAAWWRALVDPARPTVPFAGVQAR